MMAIFRKEFRDLLPWIPLSLLLLSTLCWFVAPRTAYANTSVEISVVGLVGGGCFFVALAFGFLQSIPDSGTEARGYLLHRPIALTKIFWAKLLAGGAAYALCLFPPLFILACYLEYKGPQTLPTNAWQLLPMLFLSIMFYAAHPAAMWTAYREAKWVGSKCFPLAFVLITLFTIYAFMYSMQWWSLIGLGAFTGIALWVIIASAHHAFRVDQFSPPASDRNRTSRLSNLGLLVVTFTGLMFVIMTGHSFLQRSLQSNSAPPRAYTVAFSTDGEVWEFSEQASGPYHLEPTYALSGRKITDSPDHQSELRPLPSEWNECVKANFHNYDLASTRLLQFNYVNWISFGNASHYLVEHRGQIYEYAQAGGLRSIITPLGVFAPDELARGRFDGLTSLYAYSGFSGQYAATSAPSLLGLPLISDKNGVYQIDVHAREIRTVINEPIDNVAIVLPRSGQEGVIWSMQGRKLHRHTLRSADPDAPLALADSDNVVKSRRYELPAVKAELSGEWEVEPIERSDTPPSLSVAETEDRITAVIRHRYVSNQYSATFDIYDANQTLMRSGTATMHSPTTVAEPTPLLPPVIWLALLLPNTNATFTLPAQIGLGMHAVFAALLAFGVGTIRGLPTQSRIAWCFIAAAIGISTPLAMFFMYPKLIREKCSECDRLRRTDLQRCEHCGSNWPRATMDGTEIIGARPMSSVVADAASI